VSKSLIIGYGNPSRRDDGVGIYIAEEIEHLTDGEIDVLICHQLGIEMAETIKDFHLIIFVDAYVGERDEELKVASVEATFQLSAFTHRTTPGSLLALTKSLYQKTPQAFMVSIRGYDFDFGTELSEETQKWAKIAVQKILEMVNSI